MPLQNNKLRPFLLFNFLREERYKQFIDGHTHFHLYCIPDSWSLSFFFSESSSESESESSFFELPPPPPPLPPLEESLLNKHERKEKKEHKELCLWNTHFFFDEDLDPPPSTIFDSFFLFFLRYCLSSSALTRYLSHWDLTEALALSPWTSSKNENNKNYKR